MSHWCEIGGISQSSIRKNFLRSIFPRLGISSTDTICSLSKVISERLKEKVRVYEIDTADINRIKPATRIKKPKIVSPLTYRIFHLGRERDSIEEIAQEVDLSIYRVKRILERKLPNCQLL